MDDIPVPAFLIAGTGLFVPFFEQRRVFPVKVQNCRKTENDKPGTEDPACRSEKISGKYEDEGGKQKDVEE